MNILHKIRAAISLFNISFIYLLFIFLFISLLLIRFSGIFSRKKGLIPEKRDKLSPKNGNYIPEKNINPFPENREENPYQFLSHQKNHFSFLNFHNLLEAPE